MKRIGTLSLSTTLCLSLLVTSPVTVLCDPAPASTQWVAANTKPSLGISTKDVKSPQGERGVLIQAVSDTNSPLKVGDVILSINGEAMPTGVTLNEMLAKKEVGNELELKVNRDGKNIPLTVTVIAEENADVKPVSGSSAITSAPDGPKVKLDNATPLKLVVEETLSSNKSKVGDTVNYSVQDDVKGPNGEILIRKGAKAGGTVTTAKGAGSFGRKGKLEFTAEWVETVDGQHAALRTTQQANGKSNQAVAIGAILFLSILGGFIKGKNATVNKNAVVPAYIDKDIEVTSATH